MNANSCFRTCTKERGLVVTYPTARVPEQLLPKMLAIDGEQPDNCGSNSEKARMPNDQIPGPSFVDAVGRSRIQCPVFCYWQARRHSIDRRTRRIDQYRLRAVHSDKFQNHRRRRYRPIEVAVRLLHGSSYGSAASTVNYQV